MRTPLSTVSYDPRPDHRRNQSPSIEIVADSDLEEPRSTGGQHRTRRQGRRINNHWHRPPSWKIQMAISPRQIVRFTLCLVLGWGFRVWRIQWR